MASSRYDYNALWRTMCAERRWCYKAALLDAGFSSEHSASSGRLCSTRANTMAFKALLSIVAIVAAIQGASGTFDDSMCTMTP